MAHPSRPSRFDQDQTLCDLGSPYALTEFALYLVQSRRRERRACLARRGGQPDEISHWHLPDRRAIYHSLHRQAHPGHRNYPAGRYAANYVFSLPSAAGSYTHFNTPSITNPSEPDPFSNHSSPISAADNGDYSIGFWIATDLCLI